MVALTPTLFKYLKPSVYTFIIENKPTDLQTIKCSFRTIIIYVGSCTWTTRSMKSPDIFRLPLVVLIYFGLNIFICIHINTDIIHINMNVLQRGFRKKVKDLYKPVFYISFISKNSVSWQRMPWSVGANCSWRELVAYGTLVCVLTIQ